MKNKLMLVDINNFVYQTYYGCGHCNDSYSIEEAVEKTIESVHERIEWIEDFK